MSYLTPATSTLSPSATDARLDKTDAGADQATIRWMERLPTELWLCILDQLCPHCCPGPVLKRGATFKESRDTFLSPDHLPSGSRRDLLAMTMVCRKMRGLAQRYIFHCFDSPPRGVPFFLFRDLVLCRPHLAWGVREMTVSSNPYIRDILKDLGNTRTLNFGIYPSYFLKPWNNGSVPDRQVGKLNRLRSLRLMPDSGRHLVHVDKGRLWLENLMKAAPGLRSLRCCRFDDRQDIRYAPQGSLNYAGLPENKITKLELVHTRFQFESLKRLLGSFKELREFSITQEDFTSLTRRPLDAHDGKYPVPSRTPTKSCC